MNLNNAKKIVYGLLFIITSYSCTEHTKTGNMKWISKYNFSNLYERGEGKNFFIPPDDARFISFIFLDENTIFLSGSIPKKDSIVRQNDFGVIYISKDRGKSYREILFPEENVKFITISDKYSLVETNSNGYSTKGKNGIYLLDNTILQYEKIDEYSSKSKILYSQFNGELVIWSNNGDSKLLNLLTKEVYDLPEDLKNIKLKLTDNNTLVYLKSDEIVEYNPFNHSKKVLKKLKRSYDAMYYEDGYIELGKLNLLKTEATMYNINEEEIYTSNEKTEKGVYRYKNFACRFTETRPYVTIRYSYDYGKTWYEYKTQDFFTTSMQKGYYKDKLIVLDVGFYDRNDDSRIMVGKFQK